MAGEWEKMAGRSVEKLSEANGAAWSQQLEEEKRTRQQAKDVGNVLMMGVATAATSATATAIPLLVLLMLLLLLLILLALLLRMLLTLRLLLQVHGYYCFYCFCMTIHFLLISSAAICER